jgi:hypothetical protein
MTYLVDLGDHGHKMWRSHVIQLCKHISWPTNLGPKKECKYLLGQKWATKLECGLVLHWTRWRSCQNVDIWLEVPFLEISLRIIYYLIIYYYLLYIFGPLLNPTQPYSPTFPSPFPPLLPQKTPTQTPPPHPPNTNKSSLNEWGHEKKSQDGRYLPTTMLMMGSSH